MHQAQASSTTSLSTDNCSSLDIKPSIQQNGTSQSSAPKQREGTTSSSGNTNNNNSSNSNNNNNTNSSSNQSSSLNGGLFDNTPSVYGNSGSGGAGYDSSYQSYHQANNVATGTGSFHSGGNAPNNGGIGGTNLGNMRTNLSPPLHSHHHHHSSSLSSSSSAGNKPQRTKPRTSAGEKETLFCSDDFYTHTQHAST